MTSFLNFFTLLQNQSILLVSDKIYSVLAILLLIFGSLIAYLYNTQRKIGRLERQMDQLERNG